MTRNATPERDPVRSSASERGAPVGCVVEPAFGIALHQDRRGFRGGRHHSPPPRPLWKREGPRIAVSSSGTQLRRDAGAEGATCLPSSGRAGQPLIWITILL